jgi:putative transcriptional regulator
MAVINRLQTLRAQKGERERRVITIEELSKETDINRQTINDYLNNRVKRFDADTIEAFCNYFGCDVGDLLFIEKEREPA